MENQEKPMLSDVTNMADSAAVGAVEGALAVFDDTSYSVSYDTQGVVIIEITINPPEGGWKKEETK